MPRSATVEQRIAWHRSHHDECNCRPIPPSLLPQIRSITALRRLLAGGDRRSIAESERAHALVRRSPARVAALAALTQDSDWLVVMRATDLLEKLAHENASWVQPYKKAFIGALADAEQWEIRLQVVRVLPLLRWTPRERERVVEILERDVSHPQKFVRAWALDSLALLAERDDNLKGSVRRHLEAFERSGSKALATRARNIRARFAKARPRGGRPT